MTVKIDSMGRIVIPVEYRREFGLKPGSQANLLPMPDGTGLALFRLVPKCANCGSERDISRIENIFVCENCKRVFKHILNRQDI